MTLRKANFGQVSGLVLLMWTSASYAQVQERLGTPNALMGRAGAAAPATVDSATINPAQAGAMKYTEIQGAGGFKSEDYLQRYPGFDPNQTTKTGLDGFPMPGFIYKVNSKLGLGGFAVPFPVKQEVDQRRIPLMIIGSQEYVDLIGSGSLQALAMGTVGYSVNNGLQLGASFSYISINGAVDLIPSNGGLPLAHVETTASFMTIRVGAKLKLHRQLTLGLVVGAYDSSTTSFKVDSAATNIGGSSGGAAAPTDQSVSSATFANPIRVGIAFQPKTKVVLTGDIEYKRVDKTKQSFSLVDLTMKKRDVADTVSLYAGGETKLGTGTALFGGSYEPSEIGQGSPGETGLAGFGFMDIAQNLGEPPSRPGWTLGGGYRWQWGEVFPRGSKDKDKDEKKPDPRMTLEAGFVYGETSIGIDSEGEQPAAYLVKRYKFPIKFIYRL